MILAAAGKGFSAGHDLKEMLAHAGDEPWQQGALRLLQPDDGRRSPGCPQPVIARVHGIATAAGCQLVSMCDLAVASETATFALPGVNVGVFCSTPAVGVGRNIEPQACRWRCCSPGKPINAATALAWGLVNRVVPAEKLDEEIGKFVEIILARSAAVVEVGKRTFYGRSISRSKRRTTRPVPRWSGTSALDDAAEGMGAFLGKRTPVWRS